VLVLDGKIVLASGADEITLTALADVPLTDSGRAAFQTENVLAAVGAAWALGITPELIRTGIETFSVV
jgi:cyanophycin synthetase